MDSDNAPRPLPSSSIILHLLSRTSSTPGKSPYRRCGFGYGWMGCTREKIQGNPDSLVRHQNVQDVCVIYRVRNLPLRTGFLTLLRFLHFQIQNQHNAAVRPTLILSDRHLIA